MKKLLSFICMAMVGACHDPDASAPQQPPVTNPQAKKILALGDSYTIGQSVCEMCRWPAQLRDSIGLETQTPELKIIATTGWATTNLMSAINSQNPSSDYDLVTLLIGVNNQYQGKPFSLYQNEFPALLQRSIQLAKGDKTHVIVVSIPDYAFTPFGQNSSNPQGISAAIDQYNSFAETYCENLGIRFVNITDITREGLTDPELVAPDGLHPSEKAYTRFVGRILPFVSALF